jgi:hypothetical protein
MVGLFLFASHHTGTPNIRVIKWRRMRWVGHLACMGEVAKAYNVLIGKCEGRDYLEDPSIDGKIKLEWILRKYGRKVWIEFIWFKMESSVKFL